MKINGKQILAWITATLMLFSAVSCGTNTEDPEDQTQNGDQTGTRAVTEVETEFVPDIEKTDYDCEFNVVMGGGTYRDRKDYYFVDDSSLGDGMSASVYERLVMIEDHIGVTFVLQDAGDWLEYAGNVIRTVQAGDDDYQLVMTETYQGITELLTSNCLYDFAELPSVNLDAPYWAGDLMEELKMNDRYLLGYSDLCLSNVHLITFNKQLLDTFNIEEDLYELVNNKQWTLERFTEIASRVSVNSGDPDWTVEDTYGLSGWGWTYLIDFATASDIKIADLNEEGQFYIAYEDNAQKTSDLLDAVTAMCDAEYSWLWPATFTDSDILGLDSGRVLFQFSSNSDLTNLRDSDIDFGVLPYPLYDSRQEQYRTLSWNGMLCVPGSIKNEDMVSDALELLNYYSGPVKVAYYEQLLGSKIANAPDDAAMLDIIWESQVSDAGLILCNTSQQMDNLVYMIPKIATEKQQNFNSFMDRNKKAAQRGLDSLYR